MLGASGLELRKNSGEEATINLFDARRNAEKTFTLRASTAAADRRPPADRGRQPGDRHGRARQLRVLDLTDDDEVQTSTVVQVLTRCGSAWCAAPTIRRSSLSPSRPTPSSGSPGREGRQRLPLAGVQDARRPRRRRADQADADYLWLVVHGAANMDPLPKRDSFNQDAVAVPIIWQMLAARRDHLSTATEPSKLEKRSIDHGLHRLPHSHDVKALYDGRGPQEPRVHLRKL